jgi:hypothetical protein
VPQTKFQVQLFWSGATEVRKGEKEKVASRRLLECTWRIRNVTEQEIKLQVLGSVNLRVFIIYFIVYSWTLPLFALKWSNPGQADQKLVGYTVYVKCNTEVRSCNHCWCGKQQILHILCVWACVCVCVCGLSYPARKAHAPCYIILCELSVCIIFFHSISWTARSSKKKYWTWSVFWFFLQILSETFLILRRTKRDIIINVHRSSCKVPLFVWDFNELEFLNKFSKNIQMSKLTKIRPVVAELFRADGRTDRQTDRYDEANRRFGYLRYRVQSTNCSISTVPYLSCDALW